MGNCRKVDFCKFSHINEVQLMHEVDKESENDKNNIAIMGFNPNGNQSINKSKNNINKNKIPRGWCYQGVHCNNKSCTFKHRDLPIEEEGEDVKTWLPSEIRGPRLHTNRSTA
jgi:hypothetical protein